MNVPLVINAGDTVIWVSQIPGYYPSDYALSWVFQGMIKLIVASVAEGTKEFKTTLTEANTKALIAGDYFYSAYLTHLVDNTRTTVGNGRITVLSNLLTATDYDGRSQAERLLEQVGVAIASIMTNGQAYKIKEREFTRANLNELIELRDKLRWEVLREGKHNGNTRIRFR